MIEVQTAQPVVDESRRYRDRSWLSIEDTKCCDVAGSVQVGEYPVGWKTVEPDGGKFPFDGLIPMGQKLFLPGEHLIGPTTQLFVDPSNHITHLAIRTAHLFGRHKMVPIAFVSGVTPLHVQLSINEDQRFFQPLIGKELLFKDGLSVRIEKVVINPHNRRVTSMVVMGRFPNALHQGQQAEDLEARYPERLVVLPLRLILHLTQGAGFLQMNSTETTNYESFEPSRYVTPAQNWQPPYPYCTDEVLFLAE